VDEESAAMITKNIDGAFDLLKSIAHDPEIVDQIPDDASVFLEFDDDPETTAKNRAAAQSASERGKVVHMHRVRAALPTSRGRTS
jgi:hypothetical protein